MHVIIGLNNKEETLIMEGKICSVSRSTNVLETNGLKLEIECIGY